MVCESKFLLYKALALSAGIVLVTGLTGCAEANRDSVTVDTDKGVLHGVETTTMRQYLGIPYAAPPVGSLRWKAPQPVANWPEVKQVNAYAKNCAQPASPFGQASTSEDCLYLNVFTPKGNGPFPVMVWIHGGALLTGESNDYDPTALVNQGVAVVTINYRLGPLGFLTHPALTAEGGGSSGNYGLMDQQAAMRWVKSNIAAFGGDASNITIFGESAGGLSTHSQIASPLASGLFQKAIVESGAYNLAAPALADAEKLGQSFATKTGCSDQSLTCLRNLPADKIIANSSAIQVGGTTLPTVDGKVLPLTLNDAFGSGRFNKVSVIEGSNQHEYSLLSAVTTDVTLGRPINASEYPVFLAGVVGSTLAPVVQGAYPLNSIETPAQTFDDVLTDAAFSCNGRKIARQLTANGATVYTYEFADKNAPMVFNIPPRPEGYGAYHAAEIQYVFPTTASKVYFGAPFTAAQTELSNRMVAYWAQFAKTGNPNASGLPTWAPYSVAADSYQTLAPGNVGPNAQFAAQHKCAIWTPGV
ncbi:carboxylesterase/lipase family protein [Noviherbaspirillum galbum]|uniref:Carboxylic ester hydrolase n=1 Tax=Noviherbaspirillum galbum TaxID=2709383 RepID=A0A6B3SXC8_9BURK|nr:carboxylesterase family protein [Noviherbaspirillum galbum]NEX63142.1 carboxylesterase family protein [Noviherbaspirillum galbum]